MFGNNQQIYTGRFAPSPTGPLHFGSLYTALASYLDAKSQNGKWLVRIDDLDGPRNVKGSAESILKTLEQFGLFWDGSIAYQSQFIDAYEEILGSLIKKQLLYPCICSRKTLAINSPDVPQSEIYPGICRNRESLPDEAYALRIKTDNRVISFRDRLQGSISVNLADSHGDFILKRKDRIIAYQFAVAVDDHIQQINHVVRGFDLLESTAKQIYLQQLLGYSSPDYMHVPIIVDQQDFKLSKQTLATAVDIRNPGPVIYQLLTLLKQDPPPELKYASQIEQMGWAIAHWNPLTLKNTPTIRQQ